jgi:3-oxoacyl-[acyl-carrier protein] reductase
MEAIPGKTEDVNMGMDYSLRGKTALVTGGTQGIGLAIVKEFAASGAEIIVTGLEKEKPDSLMDLDVPALKYWNVDFCDAGGLDLFTDSLRKLARLDICVNNAGINRNNAIDEAHVEDFDTLYQCNLRAPFLITKEVGRLMKNQQAGRIVNIASIWSVISRSKRAAYSASKFGLVGLTKAAAADLAPYNVLVNAVSPGFTMTELTKATLSKEDMEELQRAVPAGRFAQPDEIARLVLFLSSGMNTYISGQNIIIDGGFTSV